MPHFGLGRLCQVGYCVDSLDTVIRLKSRIFSVKVLTVDGMFQAEPWGHITFTHLMAVQVN